MEATPFMKRIIVEAKPLIASSITQVRLARHQKLARLENMAIFFYFCVRKMCPRMRFRIRCKLTGLTIFTFGY